MTTQEHIFGWPTSILNLDALEHGSFFALDTELKTELPSVETLIPDFYNTDALNQARIVAPRTVFEARQDLVHFATYCVVTRFNPRSQDLEFFLYQRTSRVGESQLAGNYSLGIGGHTTMDPEADQDVCFTQILNRTVTKELLEEVRFSDPRYEDITKQQASAALEAFLSNQVPLGVIHDRSNAVGERHLGLVGLFHLTDPSIDVHIREDELHQIGWVGVDQLKSYIDAGGVENWSVIAAEAVLRILPTNLALEL